MANRAVQKGNRGEYEVRDMLQPIVDKVYKHAGKVAPILKRNLEQRRSGGADLDGLPWLALEVKYREALRVDQWWAQAKRQAREGQDAVLIHRANYQPWRVRMYGALTVGPRKVRCPVDITVEAFLVWFELRLRHELGVLG